MTGGDCANTKDPSACDRMKAECFEKRPPRRAELEPQDGMHCRPDGDFTLEAETDDDAVAVANTNQSASP